MPGERLKFHRAPTLAIVSDSLLFRIRQKPVSHAAHRQQVPRLRGIVFNVAPQPHHKIVDGARVGVLVQAPDFFENLLARNHAPVIAHQMAQQFRFHQRQMNDIVGRAQFERAEVDGLAAE